MTPARELTLVYVAVAAMTFGLATLRVVPLLEDYVGLAVGAVFFLATMRLVRREPRGAERYGVALDGVLLAPDDAEPLREHDFFPTLRRALPSAARELGFALLLSAIIFPPFAVGFWVYHGPNADFVLRLPREPLEFLLGQLLVVALPEEAFFRGYVQTRATDAWPSTTRILGTDVSVRALLVQSAAFAVVHLAAELNVERLAVFFPGLLFGWMRARRGGIGAAIVFHALSNFYSETLYQSWAVGRLGG